MRKPYAGPARGAPVNPAEPIAGYYRGKRVRGGPWQPIRIWHGKPFDPATGEECDRSVQWRAERDGEQVDVFEVWPYCAGQPISEAEFRFMRATAAHARQHEPHLPEAAPGTPIDLNRLPALF